MFGALACAKAIHAALDPMAYEIFSLGHSYGKILK